MGSNEKLAYIFIDGGIKEIEEFMKKSYRMQRQKLSDTVDKLANDSYLLLGFPRPLSSTYTSANLLYLQFYDAEDNFWKEEPLVIMGSISGNNRNEFMDVHDCVVTEYGYNNLLFVVITSCKIVPYRAPSLIGITHHPIEFGCHTSCIRLFVTKYPRYNGFTDEDVPKIRRGFSNNPTESCAIPRSLRQISLNIENNDNVTNSKIQKRKRISGTYLPYNYLTEENEVSVVESCEKMHDNSQNKIPSSTEENPLRTNEFSCTWPNLSSYGDHSYQTMNTIATTNEFEVMVGRAALPFSGLGLGVLDEIFNSINASCAEHVSNTVDSTSSRHGNPSVDVAFSRSATASAEPTVARAGNTSVAVPGLQNAPVNARSSESGNFVVSGIGESYNAGPKFPLLHPETHVPLFYPIVSVEKNAVVNLIVVVRYINSAPIFINNSVRRTCFVGVDPSCKKFQKLNISLFQKYVNEELDRPICTGDLLIIRAAKVTAKNKEYRHVSLNSSSTIFIETADVTKSLTHPRVVKYHDKIETVRKWWKVSGHRLLDPGFHKLVPPPPYPLAPLPRAEDSRFFESEDGNYNNFYCCVSNMSILKQAPVGFIRVSDGSRCMAPSSTRPLEHFACKIGKRTVGYPDKPPISDSLDDDRFVTVCVGEPLIQYMRFLVPGQFVLLKNVKVLKTGSGWSFSMLQHFSFISVLNIQNIKVLELKILLKAAFSDEELKRYFNLSPTLLKTSFH